MALKIKHKGVDKHTHCTIYGFVYDDRKIKAQWLTGENDNKKIVQMDKDGNFITEHKSIRSAGRSLNKGMGNIANCCRGVVKSAYGYKWCYKNEKE